MGGGVVTIPGGRHPLSSPWVSDRAGGEEEAGAGVVSPAAQVVVREDGEAGTVTGSQASNATEVLEQVVVAAGAVVAADTGGQVEGDEVGGKVGERQYSGLPGVAVTPEVFEAGILERVSYTSACFWVTSGLRGPSLEGDNFKRVSCTSTCFLVTLGLRYPSLEGVTLQQVSCTSACFGETSDNRGAFLEGDTLQRVPCPLACS